MRNRLPRTSPTGRPETTATIPDDQARALRRRHDLDERQRAYQAACTPPHILQRRPPG